MVNNDVQNKASWVQSTLYDYRLDRPAIQQPNLETDDLDTHSMMAFFYTNDFEFMSKCMFICRLKMS